MNEGDEHNYELERPPDLHGLDPGDARFPTEGDDLQGDSPNDNKEANESILVNLSDAPSLVEAVGRIARTHLGASHPHLADIIQGSLEKVLEAQNKALNQHVPKNWLRKVVKHHSINVATRGAAKREVPSEVEDKSGAQITQHADLVAPDPLTEILANTEADENKEKAKSALEGLSPLDRDIVVLRTVEGHDWETIAKMLGGLTALGVASVVALRVRHNRALSKMRRELDSQEKRETLRRRSRKQ